MNLKIDKKELGDAISKVVRFAQKSIGTLPVLGGIFILAEKNNIQFRATNLETSINFSVEGTVEKDGSVVIPATLLKEITNSFDGSGSVTLSHTGDVVTISAHTLKSTLKTLSTDDFPIISPPDSVRNTFSVSGTLLKSLISSVVSCASVSTVRPELASVFIRAEGGVIKAVATDSFRLAEKRLVGMEKIAPFSMLIPAKNASDIRETLPDDEVTVSFDEHMCAFSFARGVITTRLASVSYPDYTQIIPKTFSAEATLLRKDFEGALRRSAVFADAFQKVRLSFDGGKKLTLHAHNADVGESDETLASALTGEKLELSFNHRYLSAPLSLITTESITLSAAGIGRPLVIRGVGDASFLYLVMPMNQ